MGKDLKIVKPNVTNAHKLRVKFYKKTLKEIDCNNNSKDDSKELV
jgi:hypothetical protein